MNNKLTKSLIIAALISMGGAAFAQSAPQGAPRAPSLEQMDANRDGQVTVKEAEAFFAKGPRANGGKEGMPPKDGKKDGKKDGSRSAKDMKDAKNQPPRAPQGDRNGKGPKHPRAADIDRNGNGIISQGEFNTFLKSMPKPPAARN